MSDNLNLKEYIRSLRPTLGENSLKTYTSILNGIWKKAHPSKPFDIDWFRNVDEVMAIIGDRTVQSRRSALSAIVVLLNGKDTQQYHDLMKIDNDIINKQYESQDKTEKQKDNWMTFDEIKANWKKEYERVKPILNAKTEPTNNELWALSKFMVLTITSGIFFPPRRSEWVDLKLKPDNKETDNWIDKKNGEFVWNSYKTASHFGRERVSYGSKFKRLLNRYLKRVGTQDYLIFDTAGNKMSQPAMTQVLNRMYGKNISTSMLRHIYMSEVHKDTPSLEELNRIARNMGHTTMMGMQYAKQT